MEFKHVRARTASRQAKDYGLNSLNEVSDLTGVSYQTLINWHNNKPYLFDIVVFGCVAYLRATKKGEDK